MTEQEHSEREPLAKRLMAAISAVLSREIPEDPEQYSEHPDNPLVVSTTGEGFRVFVPVAFSEPTLPEWIQYLPKPGQYRHPQYGDLVFTAERNRQFVENFQGQIYQDRLPLDAEHESRVTGALAWVEEMRLNPDGSADARVTYTPRGVELLSSPAGQAPRFRYFSPEILPQWPDPVKAGVIHQNVAIGGAFTTRPFFKPSALRPLVASESGIQLPDVDTQPVPLGAGRDTGPQGQETGMPDAPTNQNPPDTGGQQPATPPPATAPASGTQTPPPENPGVINPPQPQQFADGQAFAELKAQNDRLAADLAKERGRIEEIERRARRQTFSEQASDWVTPTKKDELIDFMERLSPEDLQFFMTLMGEHTTQVKKFAELGRLSMQEFDEPEGEPVNDDEIKDLMNMSPMGRAISRNNGQQ